MKVLFENTTEYNKNEINKFQAFHSRINRPFVIYLIFMFIFLMFLLIVNIINKNWQWVTMFISLGIILFVYYKFFKKEKDKKNNIKLTDKKFKFSFYNNYLASVDITNKKSEQAITNYFEIKKVYETEENFYLYVGETYAFVINKNNFTIGKLCDFRKFIKKKCIFRYRRKYMMKKLLKM